jgi:hypothetical protein
VSNAPKALEPLRTNKHPLEDFVASRIGLVVHSVTAIGAKPPRPMSERQRFAKYSFKHGFFYPCEAWLPARFGPLASQLALNHAKESGLDDRIWRMNREDVARATRVPAGRNGLYYEHVYSGEMCWNAMLVLQQGGHLAVETVTDLLLSNYCTAWVDRDIESAKVPTSKRGADRASALQAFEKAAVPLYNRAGLASQSSHRTALSTTKSEPSADVEALVVRLGFVVAGADGIDAREMESLQAFAHTRSTLSREAVQRESELAAAGIAALSEADWEALQTLDRAMI